MLQQQKGRMAPFVMTPTRVWLTVVISVVVWAISWMHASIFWMATSHHKADVSAHMPQLLQYGYVMGLIGAAVGVVLALVNVLCALREPDIETARAPGLWPVGQLNCNLRAVGVGIVAGIIIALWPVSSFVPAMIELRGTILRALAGGVTGFVAASVSCGLMFHLCRRPTTGRRIKPQSSAKRVMPDQVGPMQAAPQPNSAASRDAGDLSPDHRWLIQQALDAGNSGDWAKAIGLLEPLVQLNQRDGEARYLLTSAVIATGDWERTVETAQESLRQVPTGSIWRARVLHPLADALVMLERYSEALAALEEAVTSASGDSQFPVDKVCAKIQLLRNGGGPEIRASLSADLHAERRRPRR